MSYTQSDINHALQIAMNALSVGRNPTDTAGMDSDDEAWYESKQGDGADMDTLILHLYKQLKAHKKKGSKKKKRTKKRSKKRSKKKPMKKAGTGIPIKKTIKKDSWPSSQGRRPKKPWYPPWEKTTVDEEEILKLIEKSMKNKPKHYRRTVRGLSEI